jgi:RHS repeat-associated protein
MRLRKRLEKTWGSGQWNLASERHYIYDGNLVVQERDGNESPLVSYTRGSDLSGTFQGAGGIGGLLARSEPGASTAQTVFYHADGNGNITCLINTNQLIVARYVYDPYGSIESQVGPVADANLYRFSTKEIHVNSGTCYYGYRFYDPSLQRWLNRDPLQERGGVNLYGFALNDPADNTDSWGLLVPGPVIAPPLVVPLAPIEVGLCAYYGASYVCSKTGFHDWLARKLTPCFQSDRDKCIQQCHDDEAAGEDECRRKRTKPERARCWEQLYEKTANCIRDCNRQYPETK